MKRYSLQTIMTIKGERIFKKRSRNLKVSILKNTSGKEIRQ